MLGEGKILRLSTNFYIDMDEFFHKQFTFAKQLYNQARHIIREQYEENKTFINSTNLNKKLREQKKKNIKTIERFVKLK